MVEAKLSPHYKLRQTKAGDGNYDEVVDVMPENVARELVRAKDATGRRILDKGIEVADGAPIGVRANLNVKKSTGTTVQTIHQGTEAQLKKGTGMFGGEAIGYGAAVTLRDVKLSVNQEARAKILSGESNKFPMASVDGHYVRTPGIDRFDGVELRFNPMKQHLFVDPDGRAVKSVSEATVVGSKVFARGTIEYYDATDGPKPARDLPTDAEFSAIVETMKISASSPRAYEFACHAASCAPPPAGTGGSKGGSGSKMPKTPYEIMKAREARQGKLAQTNRARSNYGWKPLDN